jgi:glycosyltransferase involved in cell wall biosynthesis
MGLELFRDNFRSELLRANRVLCASASLASSIAAYMGLGESVPFEVLPLGYEPRFGDRSDNPLSSGLRIGYWGAVTVRKGVDLLIEGFRQLVGRHPDRHDLSLHIYGAIDRSELEVELKKQAEGLDVTFHGRFEYADIQSAELNMAVFPSRCRETYGLVLDEAFELGLPVIVPDIGALPERAGAAGLVFHHDDAHSLADCLVQALNPACRESLIAEIPPPALDGAAHALKVIDVYTSVLGNPRDRASLPPAVSEQQRAEWLALRAENQFRRLLE